MMTIKERITDYVNQLPPSFQIEALDYVEFLFIKAQKDASESSVDEDRNWLAFSLASAMRDMEDEDEPAYNLDDLKVVFEA